MRPMLLACFTAAAGLCAALCAEALAHGGWPEEPPASEPGVKELIAKLGSENFEVREAATRRLMERADAVAALREALTSRDPEVARRAKEILGALARREKDRAFAAFADALKPGEVDRAVERFVRREKWDDEAACWRALAGLADKLTDLERRTYGKVSLPSEYDANPDPRLLPFEIGSWGAKIAGARPGSPAVWERRFVIRAEAIREAHRVRDALLAITGDVRIDDLSRCVVFAGGSVEVAGTVSRSLIVCDGDLTSREGISNSLIIARGKVRCDTWVTDARVISSGRVEWKHPEYVRDTKVVEKEAKPLGFVTFFDPADVGITVESADGGVRVKAAQKGKPFATAGLRADDLITALDGDAVKDAESFRRLLRAKLAVAGTTTVKVRRGDKSLEIPVAHKD